MTEIRVVQDLIEDTVTVQTFEADELMISLVYRDRLETRRATTELDAATAALVARELHEALLRGEGRGSANQTNPTTKEN